MKKALLILLVLCMSVGIVFAADLPSWKDEFTGWGSVTRGGLDGKVIKVTNLNADGPGSLREALEAEGARTVVFEVGGVIDLEKAQIKIENPNLTVYGQTAPSPGITVIRGGITIATHDVVFQHLRFRMGDAGAEIGEGYEPEISTSANGNAYNIVVDHCSVSWGVDENLSVSSTRGKGPENATHDVTYSNNIIGEGLAYSVHTKQTMNHSMGTLVMDDCTNIAIIGNFYAHNYERNPWFKGNTSGIVVNNLIYDPGAWSIRLAWIPKEWNGLDEVPGTPVVSIVGNYQKNGPSTEVAAMIGSNYPENDERAYIEDNLVYEIDGVTPGKLTDKSIPITIIPEKPIWYDGLDVLKSEDVPDYILKYAGARPAERDEIDERLINDYLNGTGKVINSQNEVGGYPTLESTYRELNIPEGADLEEWVKPYTAEVMPD